jgi:hypothetical protein
VGDWRSISKSYFLFVTEFIRHLHIEKSLEWGLKAHEFFSSFMHQKGIIRDNELRKIEREIEELNVPLRKFYERNTWKYKFLEAWR